MATTCIFSHAIEATTLVSFPSRTLGSSPRICSKDAILPSHCSQALDLCHQVLSSTRASTGPTTGLYRSTHHRHSTHRWQGQHRCRYFIPNLSRRGYHCDHQFLVSRQTDLCAKSDLELPRLKTCQRSLRSRLL